MCGFVKSRWRPPRRRLGTRLRAVSARSPHRIRGLCTPLPDGGGNTRRHDKEGNPDIVRNGTPVLNPIAAACCRTDGPRGGCPTPT